jgi:hypothetical protein
VPSTQTATCPSGKNPIGYPVAYDDTTYGCRDGDVFVSGTLKGQLTIGTEHDTVIVGDLTYASGTGGSDLLGLIASQFVKIYHPVDGSTNLSDSRNPRVPFTNPVVDAAVLALNDSFIVQNHDDGASLGTIHVLGAIAQQWRGPVGTTGGGGTGYLKDYDYDERLQYDSPPFAFNTLTSAYNPKLWAETKDPAACGSPAVQPCLPP